MADKSVGELIAAKSVTPTDLFVLEQNGTAKKLTGQILENWLVSFADGHGGIHNIEKVKTSGLVDTYRITLADTTTFDFMVTNGKGINSVSKVSTSGLVDTYRITFNDGTSSTFTVTNGEKGDKGDNQYVWIKYASQKPTVTSHSFGDVADDWIGIYSGSSDTAPTDWTQYEWFKIKGEQGDTGEPAILVSSSVTYQAGDSGTIIPSGSWSESIPPVSQGKYLWTREITQFNTGNPITKYSVSRFGIDGTGSVSTVAGISPDATGNVPLTASDVKALPVAGGTMEGPINMNGQKLSGLNAPTKDDEAATKGYVDTNKVDKTNVVNNFTTTEEGFVADARALKVLNDLLMPKEVEVTILSCAKLDGGDAIRAYRIGNIVVVSATFRFVTENMRQHMGGDPLFKLPYTLKPMTFWIHTRGLKAQLISTRSDGRIVCNYQETMSTASDKTAGFTFTGVIDN